MIGPPKIKYLTNFWDNISGLPRISHPVIQLDENIQDMPNSLLDCINLKNIMKDVNTNIVILKSTEEPDSVPQEFLEDDEDNLFEKDNNHIQKDNKYYVIIVLKYLLILFIETQQSSEDSNQDEK